MQTIAWNKCGNGLDCYPSCLMSYSSSVFGGFRAMTTIVLDGEASERTVAIIRGDAVIQMHK